MSRITKYLTNIPFNKDASGNVLVFSVLAVVVFIGVSGLSVDYGNAIYMESKLKSAADVATLAGIQEVPYDTQVEYQVQDYMKTNYTYADDIKLEIGSDDESCWTIASHQVPTYFMRFFGQETLTINAKSRAILEPVDTINGSPGIMPFGLLNPNKNQNPDDDLKGNNHGMPYVLKYGPYNTMIEDWYFGRQIVADGVVHGGNGAGIGEDAFSEGEIVVDIGWRDAIGLDPKSDDPDDGNDSGENYEKNIASSWLGNVEIGDFLKTNYGNMTVPTVDGRKERLKDWCDTEWDDFVPNLDPENGRIIIVPVISLGKKDALGIWHEAGPEEILTNDYSTEYCRVDGFAAFFLLQGKEQVVLPGGDEVETNWIIGRYLHDVNVGGSSNNPGGDSGPDLGMLAGRLVPF